MKWPGEYVASSFNQISIILNKQNSKLNLGQKWFLRIIITHFVTELKLCTWKQLGKKDKCLPIISIQSSKVSIKAVFEKKLHLLCKIKSTIVLQLSYYSNSLIIMWIISSFQNYSRTIFGKCFTITFLPKFRVCAPQKVTVKFFKMCLVDIILYFFISYL